jgi:hypothetical protein
MEATMEELKDTGVINYEAIYKKSNSEFMIQINMGMRKTIMNFIMFIFNLQKTKFEPTKKYSITFDDSDAIKYHLKTLIPLIKVYHSYIDIYVIKGFMCPYIAEIK